MKIETAKFAKRQNDAWRNEKKEKAAFERKLAEDEDLQKIQFAEKKSSAMAASVSPSEQEKKSVIA